MGINKDNARVFGSTLDAVYLAPIGTPLPTTIDEALHPSFEHVGWLHTDGITETFTGSPTDIRGHQGNGVVRKRIDTPGTQYSFTALESKPQTTALRYDEKSTSVTAGVLKTTRGAGQKVSQRAVVVDKYDADFTQRHERDVFTQWDIIPNGDRVFAGTDVAGFPMLAEVIGNYDHFETVDASTANPLEPTLTSVSPTTGAVGATVTLTGTEFTGVTAVRFGAVSATSFTVVSNTSITAVVPAGTAGPAPIKVFKGVLDSDAVVFTRS